MKTGISWWPVVGMEVGFDLHSRVITVGLLQDRIRGREPVPSTSKLELEQAIQLHAQLEVAIAELQSYLQTNPKPN
ncbi:hypothetical protein ABE494_06330 [Stenotrophomonas lactitubi]|uniref:hypothetical protein n=1 Tax=Stenotrophomonas lactitubi TaxID=2045214 RepID=UPI0020417E45|nr:hypothetical protein [Stenotrophomonas lactitubi]